MKPIAKTAKKMGLVVLVLLAVVVLYAALKSPHYGVSREIVIEAPPQKIFPLVSSARACDEWMPWKQNDPGAVMNYSGPETGVGSKSTWDSKGEMGTGSAEVIESIPDRKVATRITFTKPMEMWQISEITLTPASAGAMASTAVRWSVSGENSFIGRLMCIFVNMEKVVGPMFEKGLNNLKAKAEAAK